MNKKTASLLALGGFLLGMGIFASGRAGTPPSRPEDIRALVDGIYSEGRVVRHIRQLSRYHRIAGGSPGYHRAVEYVTNFMRSLGPYEVEVEEHIADGETLFLKWRSKPSWNIRRAQLRIVETGEKVADYDEIPVSVIVYCRGCDLEAEAVYVGPGVTPRDYDGRDIRGRIVLATGPGNLVHQQAVIQRGAAGIVVGPTDDDELAEKYPDLVFLHRLKSNKSLWDKTGFGFSLSLKNFKKLVDIAQSGRGLRLQAVIEADLSDGMEETVSALLRGRDFSDKEFVLSAHLDHYKPGANDNASGCATLMEMARCISTLMETGRIPRPRRSIRFLWVGEMHGFAAYLAQDPGIGDRAIAGINLDMVGENTGKTCSVMNLVRTPFSNPSFISDLMEKLIRSLDETPPGKDSGLQPRMNYRFSRFETGSDHFMLTDPTIGVPTVNLGHSVDVFHHTSMDGMEMIDPLELRRSGSVALAAALITSNAEEDTVLGMIEDIEEKGVKRMAAYARTRKSALDRISTEEGEAGGMGRHLEDSKTSLDVLTLVEIGRLRSLLELDSSPAVESGIQRAARFLESFGEMAKSSLNDHCADLCARKRLSLVPARMPDSERELEKIVPVRLFRGPISQYYFEDVLGDRIQWYLEYSRRDPLWVNRRTEIINFMDGKRNLLQIYHAVNAEFGRGDPEFYRKFAEDLRNIGWIEYRHE